MIPLSTCALHLIARLAIRSVRPARAFAVVDAAARFAPRLSEDAAREALHTLEGRGTCLSRSLAVATRLEGARIAIGVCYGRGAPLRAHAWVVMTNGAPLRFGDPDGDIIALLDGASALRGGADRLTQRVRFA